MSSATVSCLPLAAARCRGVRPSCSHQITQVTQVTQVTRVQQVTQGKQVTQVSDVTRGHTGHTNLANHLGHMNHRWKQYICTGYTRHYRRTTKATSGDLSKIRARTLNPEPYTQNGSAHDHPPRMCTAANADDCLRVHNKPDPQPLDPNADSCVNIADVRNAAL
jgi:hypothetical protein